jgi:hypothetical protein
MTAWIPDPLVQPFTLIVKETVVEVAVNFTKALFSIENPQIDVGAPDVFPVVLPQ